MIPRGFLLFPVSLSKSPLTPNGYLDASDDPDVLSEWSRQFPDAGWAVACAPSGLFVLDIDPRNGGDRTYAELVNAHGKFPPTLAAITGGGGVHFYFRMPPGEGLRFRKTLGPGIDVKVNGYVVIPPSPHASGGRYTWCSEPEDTPLAEVPAWVLALVLRGEPENQYTSTGEASKSFLAKVFAAAGLLGRELDTERICCRCPLEHMHSDGRGAESSTIIFAPTAASPLGKFWCSHSSHGGLTLDDLMDLARVLPLEAFKQALSDFLLEASA